MRAHHFIHRICILTALSLTTPAIFSQPVAPDLKAAVDAAWQRSPQARTLIAQQDEALAEHEAAQTWLAGSPTIGVSQRSDRWTEQNGVRETEVSLATPVWLPGQKTARQALAQAGSDALASQIASLRLAIAGEVRERLWAVAAAQESLAAAENNLRLLEAISGEVSRRVKAGDLAKTDGMLAQQEVLAAQAAVSAAKGKLLEELTRYQMLTGRSPMATPQPEPVENASQAPHPRIVAAKAALQRAQASLDVIHKTRSDSPTVGMSMRRERDRPATPASHSVSIGIQIPIGTAARNRPLEAAAQTKIETASAEASLAEAAVRADIELARQQLAAAELALEAATQRTTLTREHTRLIDKAFRLGERGLAELLRSQALSNEAEISERQQRVALGLARARLNQAMGLMP